MVATTSTMIINSTEELLQFVTEQRSKEEKRQLSEMLSPPSTPRTRGSAELFTDEIPSSLLCTPRKAQKADPFEPPPPPDWRAPADDLFGGSPVPRLSSPTLGDLEHALIGNIVTRAALVAESRNAADKTNIRLNADIAAPHPYDGQISRIGVARRENEDVLSITYHVCMAPTALCQPIVPCLSSVIGGNKTVGDGLPITISRKKKPRKPKAKRTCQGARLGPQ